VVTISAAAAAPASRDTRGLLSGLLAAAGSGSSDDAGAAPDAGAVAPDPAAEEAVALGFGAAEVVAGAGESAPPVPDPVFWVPVFAVPAPVFAAPVVAAPGKTTSEQE
jgi:hypothetical protein